MVDYMTDKQALMATRNLILRQIDYIERNSSHRPLTNVILADYADEFSDSKIKPVIGNIKPEHNLDRRSLMSTLSNIETIAGFPFKDKTSTALRWYKSKM